MTEMTPPAAMEAPPAPDEHGAELAVELHASDLTELDHEVLTMLELEDGERWWVR